MQQFEHKQKAFALLQMPGLLSSFQHPLFNLTVEDVNWDIWTLAENEKKVRFGHYMEALFAACLKASFSYTLLEQNVQLITNGITQGELDFLIFDTQKNQYLHIELACKFFLHLPETNKFIGPNKRDRLDLKLKKLIDKQFPNLFSNPAQLVLQKHKIQENSIIQQLALKGMIFTKWDSMETPQTIHPQAISGKWFSLNALQELNAIGNLFSFPEKVNWIMPVQHNAEWMPFKEAVQTLLRYKQQGKNPMVWLKSKNDGVARLFVLD